MFSERPIYCYLSLIVPTQYITAFKFTTSDETIWLGSVNQAFILVHASLELKIYVFVKGCVPMEMW